MIRRTLMLVVTVTAAFLLGTTPAWAHGGPIAIQATSDGGQGITATVTYTKDGHPVETEVVMTYTAVSEKGRTIGPLPLTASAEGQAFYVSKDKLPLGKWTVTVTATRPSAATQTISLTSAKLPPVKAVPVPSPAGLPIATLVAIPVALAAIGFVVVLVLRRRRSVARV
jgi:hypothetical protein